jgi:hypothetical protein
VPPDQVNPPQPPSGDLANKIVVAVYRPGQGWSAKSYDPALHPDHGLPGGPQHPSGGPVLPPRPDQGLPAAQHPPLPPRL